MYLPYTVISGTHYFMNMSNNLPCEKIYPVFLMYNIEEYLAAFGWVFQGRPDNFYSDDGMGWFHITPLTYPVSIDIYPLMTKGLAHHYHLGESTVIFRGIISDFEFLFHFWI